MSELPNDEFLNARAPTRREAHAGATPLPGTQPAPRTKHRT